MLIKYCFSNFYIHILRSWGVFRKFKTNYRERTKFSDILKNITNLYKKLEIKITIYPNFFVFNINFSNKTTASYINAATKAKITTLAITKSS